MNVSSASLTRPGRTKSLVLAALVAAVGMLALAGPPKANASTPITADHGKLTLGAVFPDNTVIPAPVMGPHCPTMALINPPAFVPPPDPADCGPSPLSQLVPNYPDGNAHLAVGILGQNATVEASQFKMPMTYVPKPGDPNTMVPIKVSAPNGLSGTWNSGTGELSLTGDLRISVATGTNPNPPTGPGDISWCQIDAPNITWSTGRNAVTPGIPFTGGLSGTGAISASWTDLPNGISINGGDCSTVNSVIHDTGAIWLGFGLDTPPEPPVCEPPSEGLWPDCVFPPPPPPRVKVSAVKLFPGKLNVGAGRQVFNLTVRVANSGNKSGWVPVNLRVNRSTGISVRSTVRVYAPMGSFGQVNALVRTNRKARGTYRISASAAGKTASSIVVVKQRRR